jgi:hypothetical protein
MGHRQSVRDLIRPAFKGAAWNAVNDDLMYAQQHAHSVEELLDA